MALHAQILFPIMHGNTPASGGGTSPSGLTVTASDIVVGVGNTFTTPTFTLSSGQSLLIAFGSHGNSGIYCGTVTGVTGTGGDVFTSLGSPVLNSSGGCVSIYYLFNPTPNASYAVIIQGVPTSPSAFNYGLLQFSKGSVAGTVDGTCSGNTAAATSLACSSAITTTGTIELAVSATMLYDNLSGSDADNSTPGFTIPVSGCPIGPSCGKVGNSVGSILLGYYVGNPPAGTLTPRIASAGLGDPIVISGAAFK